MTLRIALLDDRVDAVSFAVAARRAGTELSERTYTLDEFPACLSGGDCDAIALPGSGPADLDRVAEAVDAGKHVLVRGPTGYSRSDLDRLGERCKRRQRVALLAPASRFQPTVRAVYDAQHSGQLGEPGLLRLHRWRSSAAADHDPDAAACRYDAADLAVWFFDRPPTTVFAVRPAVAEPLESCLQIHLGFPRGGMALLDDASCLPGRASYFSLSLIGSRGAAHADDHHNTQLHFSDRGPGAFTASQGEAPLINELNEFASCVERSRWDHSCGRAQLLSRLCEAVEQSLASGDAASL